MGRVTHQLRLRTPTEDCLVKAIITHSVVCGNEIEQGLHGGLGRGTHQLRLRTRWGGETLLGETEPLSLDIHVEVCVVIYPH